LLQDFFNSKFHNYLKNVIKRSYYQTTADRKLRRKQHNFPQKTAKIYIQDKEVKTSDGYAIVEPLLSQNRKPHELHLIKKIASVFGEPFWVRDALDKLGFDSRRKNEWKIVFNIQPNTLEVNQTIMLCKHMVKVLPVVFLNGYPSEKDIGNTQINLETGEFEIIKSLQVKTYNDNLKYYELNGVKISDELKPSDTFPLDKIKMRDYLNRRRQLCKLNDEYFPAEYDYKYDQDKPGVIKLKGKTDTSIKEDEVEEF
jgi:hypothetical protein